MNAVFQTTILALVFAAAPAIALAQTNHAAHAAPQASVATAPSAALADGEVRAIDRAAGSIVIKHGPLTALNMGPMTMEFIAKDPALLAKVKVGDRVKFTPAQGKDGTLLVTSIAVVPN